MSSFLNRLRSKSVTSITSINQLTGNNQLTVPTGPLGYLYIENFEFTSEDECIKIDNENLNLYKKNKCLYDEMTKKIETKNALFRIEKAPSPPIEPNNYEKFVKYKQRNITRNVKLQTFAVQKLLEKRYRLQYELIDNKTDIDFEPFQAIELLEKIEDDTIENIYKNKLSPQMNRKYPSTPTMSSSPPQLIFSPEYSPYYHPQPSAQYYPPVYPPVYPSLSQPLNQSTMSALNSFTNQYTPPSTPTSTPPSTTSPIIHRNVAPPASHYISSA